MDDVKLRIKKLLVDGTFLFMTGAYVGWLYEVLLHLVKDGTFVNRGMLHGPWLPIYGIGCLIVVGLKQLIGNRPGTYFVVSVAACGVIEYVTSWLMETVYHMRWWDYSGCWMNLNGRIFLGGLLGFGAAGCLFAFGVLPVLEKHYQKIPFSRKEVIAFLMLLAFFVDMVISLLCPNAGTGITNG